MNVYFQNLHTIGRIHLLKLKANIYADRKM